MQNLRMQNFVTKYAIFCELLEKMSVPDIKNLGLAFIRTHAASLWFWPSSRMMLSFFSEM